MRKNKQQKTVRKTTAGNVERSMLGKVYLWVSERKNSKYAQRPHKTYQRRQPKSISEWSLRAPTACWRRLKAWQDKKNARVPKYLHGLRKDKRNGN